jgi:hypothetical protein
MAMRLSRVNIAVARSQQRLFASSQSYTLGWTKRYLAAAAHHIVEKHPLQLSCGILFTKGVVCDTLAQRIEGKEEQDFRRTAIMGAYGGFCEAPMAYFFYSKIFPRVFGASRSLSTVLQMLLIENIFLWPLLIYPSYYAVEAVGDSAKIARMRAALLDKAAGAAAAATGQISSSGATLRSSSTTGTVEDVVFNLQRYSQDWWAVTKVSVQVWVPVNFINFRFMPTNLRTPFMGMCAFGYTTFWSFQQSQLRKKDGGA